MKIQERNKCKYTYVSSTKRPKKNWSGIPAVIKIYDTEISLSNNLVLSIIWHIVFIILLGVIFTTLKIGDINPIFKPKEKIQDMQFVLNNASKHSPVLSTSNSTPEIEKETNNSTIESKNNVKPTNNVDHKDSAAVTTAVSDDFSIPIPKIRPMSGFGGIGNKMRAKSEASSTDSSSIDIGDGDGSSSGNGSTKGTGFDKNAVRKAISTYDISPYVNELKRDIRLNWKPPIGQENKSVELFLRIAKDGRLIILNVKKTSEAGEVDNAALNAVRKTLPLNPLPSKYSKSYLDVVFTFDSFSVRSKY